MARQTRRQHCTDCLPNVDRWMHLCIGGLMLFSIEHVMAASLQKGVEEPLTGETGAASWPGIVAKCPPAAPARGGGGDPDPIPVTLSRNQLVTTLQCSEADTEEVPRGLSNVCVSKDGATVDACSKGTGESGDVVALKDVLGEGSDAKWVKKGSETQTVENAWVLQLQETDLPFTDESFFVGCQRKPSASGGTVCRVNVTVEARASSATGTAVTCAYGSHSNPEALNVEITEEKNTLTLACGQHGAILPTKYDAVYCDDDKLTSCTKSYGDIFQNYSQTWWNQEKQSAPVTLTVPKGAFPAQDKTFYVGCNHTSLGTKKPGRAGTAVRPESDTAKGVSQCRVKVTVKAASSGSFVADATRVGLPLFGVVVLGKLLSVTV
ncbi:SAG-related sequence [Besnoitia besnoiti]|uniref:SAG-related sequence n=1 Tax=Besnoitia besnoiti TaxID=94643 RepID=A0A2A9MMN5_BESBE|nr:SAG-related sequence [Besnoitia besnoiti]PFH37047.1 SAG-related sequence [Besnoitia besnoiti]